MKCTLAARTRQRCPIVQTVLALAPTLSCFAALHSNVISPTGQLYVRFRLVSILPPNRSLSTVKRVFFRILVRVESFRVESSFCIRCGHSRPSNDVGTKTAMIFCYFMFERGPLCTLIYFPFIFRYSPLSIGLKRLFFCFFVVVLGMSMSMAHGCALILSECCGSILWLIQ